MRKKIGNRLAAELKGALWVLAAVLAFHSLIAKPFFIPSGSLLPTLWIGDRLIVSKWPDGWSYVSPRFHILPFFGGRLFGRLPERATLVMVKPAGLHTGRAAGRDREGQ